jgi:penicillin-binding protein 1A
VSFAQSHRDSPTGGSDAPAGVSASATLQALGRGAAVLGVALLALVAVAGVCVGAYALWLFHDLPNAGDLADYRPPTSTRVYAWDGTLIGEFGKERRIFVPYDQIPPQVVRAFLAAEDRNFFEHGGIDVQGLGRALTRDAVGLVSGKRLQGGSTITQQVAKNVLLGNEQSFGRKLKEAILARRLEQTLSKERILELYLNEIWLGNHSYGVGMAAYNYFGKPLNQLNLQEMAYLATLPKGPANYDPVRRKTAAIGRRNWVIGQMVENGWATPGAARYAMGQDLVTQKTPERAHYKDADYFMEEVRQRAIGSIGKDVEDQGLYIRTTLDSHLQTAARVALMKGLEAYDHRHGWRGPLGHVDPSQPGWEREALSKTPASERRAWRAAAVDKASGGAVHVVLPSGEGGEIEGADVAWARAGKKPLEAGDLVFVEPKSEGSHVYGLRQAPAVNGALVAIEPHSGKVLALVGGYSYSLSNFNRATQAMRQPGSAFKPFVYATALENSFTPASIVLDAPISLPGANGQVWSPENYGHGSAGPTIFRNGLVFSRNQMTVRIAQATGMKKIVAMAEQAGVADKGKMAPVLAMALGAGETTPFKLTAAYSAFANGGFRVEPHLIEEATDRTGKAVWRADQRDCPRCDAPYAGQDSPRVQPAGAQVMDPVTAYSMTLMLKGVVQNGTAYAVSSLGRPLAGKTGTTNAYRSAWFVGYSPDLVVGTFVGFDDNRSLGEGETGAVDAVPIFIDFMKEALKDTPSKDFTAPPNAKIVTIHGHPEAFRPGTEPKPRPAAPTEETPALIGADGRPARGPIPYGQLQQPAAAPPPPEPKKAPADLSGLY